MLDLITSFIVQAKECKLPGIGKFRQTTTPAEADLRNNQILPPVTEVIFTGREDKISNELINYVASKKDVPIAEAQTLIEEWCTGINSKLNNGQEILLPSFGSLKKTASGNIFFQRQHSFAFFVPVAAENIVHQNSAHAMLVGDRETNSSEMDLLLNQEKVERTNRWKITALILFAIALLLLFFYFYQHPFSLSSSGNQQKISPETPPATYIAK